MFFSLILIIFRVNEFSVHAQDYSLSERKLFTPPQDFQDVNELNKVLFSDLGEQKEELKKVKLYLLNGEVRLARMYLNKMTYTQTKLRPLIYRYLAILSFAQNDFKKTHEYLMIKELQIMPHFSKICTLLVLTEIVLKKNDQLEKNWSRCQQENAQEFKDRNLVWMDTLVSLRLSPRENITRIPFKGLSLQSLYLKELKVMLRLVLYLNQEKLVVDKIPELTVDQLQDIEVRELVGQIFFRTQNLAKSYQFVEDLKSPNAENIKGNLYLLRQKYELAYSQFKLALEQKQNSQNAMERLLPLAWLLGDWENGSRYAEQVMASPKSQIHKLTLVAAFLMQKGNYDKANSVLQRISELSPKGSTLEIAQLASFTALMQNRPDNVKKQANVSCSQYDLINCWVLYQMEQWDAFALTIRREDKIPERREWEKLIKDDPKPSMQETVFINQLDIEEMDDKLIHLIPKN